MGKRELWGGGSPISNECPLPEVTHITSAPRALVTINHMATTTTKGPGNAILLWHGRQKAGNICVTALVITTTGLNKAGLFCLPEIHNLLGNSENKQVIKYVYSSKSL